MKNRGRKSAAALAIVQPNSITAISRPKPPACLSTDQANEWRAIVNSLPADWFPRETHNLLMQYCRHVEAAAHVALLIDGLGSDGKLALGLYEQLLKMQEREGRAISSLATRMRLSQQSRFTNKKKRGDVVEDPPWKK